MQSDSTPDPGTTPDSKSLTDLWREYHAADLACPADRFHLLPDEHKAYQEATTRFFERLDEVQGRLGPEWVR